MVRFINVGQSHVANFLLIKMKVFNSGTLMSNNCKRAIFLSVFRRFSTYICSDLYVYCSALDSLHTVKVSEPGDTGGLSKPAKYWFSPIGCKIIFFWIFEILFSIEIIANLGCSVPGQNTYSHRATTKVARWLYVFCPVNEFDAFVAIVFLILS